MTEGPDERVARLERRLERERAARAEAERIAEDALRRSFEANELKTVLLGTVNHELRTPATVIQGFARQLAEHWYDYEEEMRIDFVRRIAGKAGALTRLIEQLLEFTAIESGVTELVTEDIALRPWLEALVAETADDHVVRLDLPADLVVRAHQGALRHIVMNLLHNARRYAPAGTTIDVVAALTRSGLSLRVRDCGPGVPVGDRLRVFEPFFRGAGDHVTVTSGFGIGLSVVKRLTGLLGGVVAVTEAPGGGAEFRVRLPPDLVVDGGPADRTVAGPQ